MNVGALNNYLTKLLSSRFYNTVRASGKKVLSAMPPMMEFAKRHLQGHVAYYAVSGNARHVRTYAYLIGRLLFKWLVSTRRMAVASRAVNALIICSCSFMAPFHFSSSWLERKRSACSRALTCL